MAFYDPRMFGRVELIKNPSEIIEGHHLGRDALDVTKVQLRDFLSSSGKPLKAFFLDQSIIAGIGNVYGDEIAFQARINPNRKAKTLGISETDRLYRALVETLKTAIRKKAYLDHWDMLPSTWLVHYRKENAQCPRCKGTIKSYKSGGRDGFWCPECQN
jgi:formamidopyrimidine-DNA glycosylase